MEGKIGAGGWRREARTTINEPGGDQGVGGGGEPPASAFNKPKV